MKTFLRFLPAAFVLPLFLSGCVLVRTTEHRIIINNDGSGEALLRFIDIRSDEQVDSLFQKDFNQLMMAYTSFGVEEFERGGKKITSKQFVVHGDTLILEIAYTFPRIESIDGLRISKDGFVMGVSSSREVVKTNGSVSKVKPLLQQIEWDLDARRLMYIIREKAMPPSRSLAGLYQNRR